MKKILFILTVMCFVVQANAQNNEVEIYIVHSDSILKGTIFSNSPDSITLQTDSVTFVSFSKNDLEGRDLAVSKEIKNLRRRLLKKEYNVKSLFADFPGNYQIKHGNQTMGYIMAGFATISIAGALVVTPIWVATNGLSGLMLALGIFDGVVGSVVLYGISAIWSKVDQYFITKKIVNSRYYYIRKNF